MRLFLIMAASLLVAFVGLVFFLDSFNGKTHVVTAGESHGFEIGMTKAEVFTKYKTLNELADITAYGSNGVKGAALIEDKPADLKYSPEFEMSDHWMAYRHKWPLDSQEFYFSNGNLTKIATHIRLFETP